MAFAIFYTVLVLWTSTFTFLATVVNPTDPTVLKEINLQLNDQSLVPENFHNFCYFWEAHWSFESKHWSQWDRWIHKFDHHWVWLNNWIGDKNYKWFLSAIISMSCQMILQNLINFLSIVMYSSNKSNYIFQPSIILFVLQIVLLIVGWWALALVGQLAIFHLWLRYHGLSTFELITLQREFEEKEKNNAEQGKKTGGTTNNQIVSGYTSNMGDIGAGKINHKASINK